MQKDILNDINKMKKLPRAVKQAVPSLTNSLVPKPMEFYKIKGAKTRC